MVYVFGLSGCGFWGLAWEEGFADEGDEGRSLGVDFGEVFG